MKLTRTVAASALMVAGVLLAGCTETGTGTPTGLTTGVTGTTTTFPTSSTVFNPNTDAFAVPKSGLLFPDAASEKLFDASVAASTAAAGEGWRHLGREYPGGSEATEKWCSPQVTADECHSGRIPQARSSIVIEHGIYTYDQSLPMSVQGQSLHVLANAADATGWSVSAYLAVRRASGQDPSDHGEQSFDATVMHGPPNPDPTDPGPPSITLTDAPGYQLTGLGNHSQLRGTSASVTVPASGDALAQLKLLTTSAAQMETVMTGRLRALRTAVSKDIDARMYTVCDMAQGLRGGRLAQPAPACSPRAITDSDVTALHAAADNWFTQQNTLLDNNYEQIFAAISTPFHWAALAG